MTEKNNNDNYDEINQVKVKMKSNEVKSNKDMFDLLMASNQKNKKYFNTGSKK